MQTACEKIYRDCCIRPGDNNDKFRDLWKKLIELIKRGRRGNGCHPDPIIRPLPFPGGNCGPRIELPPMKKLPFDPIPRPLPYPRPCPTNPLPIPLPVRPTPPGCPAKPADPAPVRPPPRRKFPEVDPERPVQEAFLPGFDLEFYLSENGLNQWGDKIGTTYIESPPYDQSIGFGKNQLFHLLEVVPDLKRFLINPTRCLDDRNPAAKFVGIEIEVPPSWDLGYGLPLKGMMFEDFFSKCPKGSPFYGKDIEDNKKWFRKKVEEPPAQPPVEPAR